MPCKKNCERRRKKCIQKERKGMEMINLDQVYLVLVLDLVLFGFLDTLDEDICRQETSGPL